MVERIFMKILAKNGHDKKSDLLHCRDVAVYPLNPGPIFLFPVSVIVSKMLEKRFNGFSLNFHEMLGTTHEMPSKTVSHLPKLCFPQRHMCNLLRPNG